MKKIIMLLSFLLVAAVGFSQVQEIRQFAFGAVGVDSITTGTQKYYYIYGSPNNRCTTKASNPIKLQVYAIQVMSTPSVKSSRVPDSVTFVVEVSLDNSNWVKWTNAGATSTATQTQYRLGGPKPVGTGATYVYGNDRLGVTTSAAGGIFPLYDCYYPYVRIKPIAYKSTCSAYITAWAILKEPNN